MGVKKHEPARTEHLLRKDDRSYRITSEVSVTKDGISISLDAQDVTPEDHLVPPKKWEGGDEDDRD